MCLVLSVALGGLKNTLLQPCNHLAVQQHPAPCSPRKPRPMKAQVLCPSLQSYFLPHELPELHQWLYRMHFTVWRLLASHTLSNLRTTASDWPCYFASDAALLVSMNFILFIQVTAMSQQISRTAVCVVERLCNGETVAGERTICANVTVVAHCLDCSAKSTSAAQASWQRRWKTVKVIPEKEYTS